MPEAIRHRKCPICGASVTRGAAPSFPFCSERCKTIDLGAWAAGRYVIPGPEIEGEEKAEKEGAEAAPGGARDEDSEGSP